MHELFFGYGVAHTIRFQRATSTIAMLTVELTRLSGYDSSTPQKVREALLAYGASLEIGQALVVPSLYGVCYGAVPSAAPTFSISLLTASVQGTATAGVVNAAWNQRFTFSSAMIQILER